MIVRFLMGGGVKSPPDFFLVMAIVILVHLFGTIDVNAKVVAPIKLTAKLLSDPKASDNLIIEVVVESSLKSALSLKCTAVGLSILEGKESLQLQIDRNESRKISYKIHKPDRNSFAEISFVLKSESGATSKALIKVNSNPNKQLKAVINNGVREIGP